jgi:hypothetical protein
MPVRVVAACALMSLGFALSGPALAQFGGFGGFGGGREDIAMVERYDQDEDGRLNRAERDLARGRSSSQASRSGSSDTASAAPALTPEDADSYSDEPLYAPDVLRTLFIDFGYADWEAELEYFYGTDVEVPATITVDGRAYPDVGIHFRGNTSFGSVPPGLKRGLNLSFDFVDGNNGCSATAR